MTKRTARINFLFLIIAISSVTGFYFLRQQSPCNINPECLQCLKDVNCFVEGDCVNKCAKKPECWGLTRCPDLSEILSKNYDEKDTGLVKSSKEEATTATSTDKTTMALGQAQMFEVNGQKYIMEIIKLCPDCRDGEGDFTVKVNNELKESLRFGDTINLDEKVDLGIRKTLNNGENLVEFYLIENVTPEKELTAQEKFINKIKNIFNSLYERFN